MKKLLLLFVFWFGCGRILDILAPIDPDRVCGDGEVQVNFGEECDDGNDADGDGCDSDCRLSCGNGAPDISEECDPGRSCEDGTPCTSDAECGGPCEVRTSPGCDINCTLPACGNGVQSVDALGVFEFCDDGNVESGDGCSEFCFSEDCGDGDVEPEQEQCDDGNNIDGDGCSSFCFIEICGSGIVEVSSSEHCDDGKQCQDQTPCERDSDCEGIGDELCRPRDGDGCDEFCLSEGCGDGIVENGEQCDDGGALGGCGEDCFSETCGDGVVDEENGEQCDNGRRCSDGSVCIQDGGCIGIGDERCLARSTDGCSSVCRSEILFVRCRPGAQAGGNGSIATPFATLQEAVNGAGSHTIVLFSDSVCGSTIIDKTVIITSIDETTNAIIRTTTGPAIISTSNSNISTAVVITNVTLESTLNFPAIEVDINNSSLLGMFFTKIIKSNITVEQEKELISIRSGNFVVFSSVINGAGQDIVSGILCNPVDVAQSLPTRMIIDASIIGNNKNGGINLNNKCGAIISNSLIVNNGSDNSEFGFMISRNSSKALIVHSVFDNNRMGGNQDPNSQKSESAFLVCDSENAARIGVGSVFNSIILESNIGPQEVTSLASSNCGVGSSLFEDTSLNVPGNLKGDPLFVTGNKGAEQFRLTPGSPCIDASQVDIEEEFFPFDMASIIPPESSVFTHDFSLRAIPAEEIRDIGMFEDF